MLLATISLHLVQLAILQRTVQHVPVQVHQPDGLACQNLQFGQVVQRPRHFVLDDVGVDGHS